jgi:hypothetical protein
MFTLDDLGWEIQEAGSLCWAAVSTMAVRAFPEDDQFKHPTQRETVIYHEAEIFTVADLVKAKTSAGPSHDMYEGFKNVCKDTGSCNLLSQELLLFDLKSKKVPAGQALTAEHFNIEIGMRRRPVTIRWRFLGDIPINGPKRIGEHALIVTGYNPATHELRIFDPWPSSDPDDGIADLAPALHEKWIPYDVYLDPQNDVGLNAKAVHDFDQYQLQRVNDDEDLARFHYPAPVAVPPRVAHRGNCVDFSEREIPDELYGAIYKVMRRHVVRDSSGAVIHGPYDAGMPIPIVALQVSEILGAKDRYELLKSKTSTVAVPVLRNGRLIDSFLMLHDSNGWKPGGYSNNQITALLCEARKIPDEKQDQRRHYLVSIPELGTFFLARGYFDKAILAGLNPRRARNLRSCGDVFTELLSKVENEGLYLRDARMKYGSKRC